MIPNCVIKRENISFVVVGGAGVLCDCRIVHGSVYQLINIVEFFA